jgi:nucleoside-diphosphate-sugar epimerase
MKDILLLGGVGYIGSKFNKVFKDKYNITNVDINWFGNPEELQYEFFDYNDVTDRYIKTFDTVILLAGHSSVKMCEDKFSSWNNNVRNFANLLKKLNGTKFIYASSSSVYGNTTEDEIDEEYLDFSPINFYDMAKLQVDQLAKLSDSEFYGLRFGTVNGPAPHIRTDVMINAMTNTAKTKGEIHLFNADTKRSILGINDLMNALETIIESNEDNRGIYNLASFTSTSGEIAEVVGMASKVKVINKDTPEVITNEKLEKKNYNFGVTTTKFQETFNFKFNDTLESLVYETVGKFDNCELKTNRSEPVEYE